MRKSIPKVNQVGFIWVSGSSKLDFYHLQPHVNSVVYSWAQPVIFFYKAVKSMGLLSKNKTYTSIGVIYDLRYNCK